MSALRKIEEVLKDAEGFVASGDATKARALLRAVDPIAIAPSTLVSFASVARRAGLPGLSARLLFPMVTSDPPHPPLLLEYSIAIADLGCRNEAIQTLARLDRRACPEALFYLGALYADLYDYRESRVHFEDYLRTDRKGIHTYSAHLARARALIGQHIFDEAQDELDYLHEESKSGRLTDKLAIEVLSAMAQCSLLQARFGTAEHLLLDAMGRVGHLAARARAPVQVWKSVLETFEALEEGADPALYPAAQEAYVKARVAATRGGLDELVRMADHYIANRTANKDRLLELYYGTPSKAYRQFLVEEREGHLHPANDWTHRFFSTVPHTCLLELEHGEFFRITGDQFAGNGMRLAPGERRLQLLRALASDFYTPLKLGQLHEMVFPGVAFNPFESRETSLGLVKGLSAWLKKGEIPLEIKAIGNLVRLVPLTRIGLKVYQRNLFG